MNGKMGKLRNSLSSELYKTSSFAREAVKRLERLQRTSNETFRNAEDPTDALQEKLQTLLLAANSCASPKPAASLRNLHDDWEASNAEDSSPIRAGLYAAQKYMQTDEKRCLVETAALRKQLDFLSSELRETKLAAALMRKEYKNMLSGEIGEQIHARKHSGRHLVEPGEGIAEEMRCRAAIRQIAAQIQAESEQWSQLQDILRNVQKEMEDLHEARDRWEERALRAEAQLLALKETVQDWRSRAQTAEEEAAFLRAERQTLQNKIDKLKHRHAVEQRKWLEQESSRMNEAAIMSSHKTTDEQEVQEKPRHASAGIQDTLDICDSIIHSRNGSARNSIDLETIQKGLLKNIKKSLDFSSNSNERNRKVRQKNEEPRELDTGETITANKEKKKREPRQLNLKENAVANKFQESMLSKLNNIPVEDFTSSNSSTTRVSLPVAASTEPPFGEIINKLSSSAQKFMLSS